MKILCMSESRADWGGLVPVYNEAMDRGHNARLVNYEQLKNWRWSCDFDWLVVLGDRPRVLEIVVDAYQSYKIRIAHLSGGDKQQGGLVDEPTRHAISKFAHVHFPNSEKSKQRLISQQEDPQKIYNVGSTMVDDLVNFMPCKTDEFYYLVQMHPSKNWRSHLEKIGKIGNCKILQHNGDPGFSAPPHCEFIPNMPREKFLQLLWNSQAFIGNSSALFLEAQYLGVPCLHVGERNRGREESFPGHTLSLKEFHSDALKELIDARTDTGLRENWKDGAHGDGTAAKKILDMLENIGVPNESILRKEWP